jgi:hypothetical protein
VVGAVLFLGFCLPPIQAAKAQPAQDCTPTKELPFLPTEQLESIVPCDSIALFYLHGIQKLELSQISEGATLGELDAYYRAMRLLLGATHPSRVNEELDATSYLIIVLASLDKAEPEKAELYRAFALSHFALENKGKIGTSELSWMLHALEEIRLRSSRRYSYEELICFVRADVPMLSVERVFSSRVYHECMTPE